MQKFILHRCFLACWNPASCLMAHEWVSFIEPLSTVNLSSSTQFSVLYRNCLALLWQAESDHVSPSVGYNCCLASEDWPRKPRSSLCGGNKSFLEMSVRLSNSPMFKTGLPNKNIQVLHWINVCMCSEQEHLPLDYFSPSWSLLSCQKIMKGGYIWKGLNSIS